MAYVLGYFAADGAMIRNKRKAHFIEFTSTDRALLNLVRRVVVSTHKIQKRERKNGRTHWKAQYRLQIGSKEWFDDLTLLGFTQNKSRVLTFPNVPKKYFADFVRGYFDGDGCVYFNSDLYYANRKQARAILMTLFTSGSKPFLEQLWMQLKVRGVTGGSIQKKNRGFELRFSHKDSVALHRVLYHTCKVPGLWLPRKRDKLERAIWELAMRE